MVDKDERLELEFSSIGEVLCKESALVQAAQVLDIASQIAIEVADLDTLMKIAAIWIEASDRLEQDQQDGGQPTGNNQFKTGFSQ